jgi:hypothetical protein
MAASIDAIAFNFALCALLIAVIPIVQLQGPTFPVPLATKTHEELSSWKDVLLQFYTGKNCFAQMTPILATWKVDLLAVPPMPPAIMELQKADKLLLDLKLRYQTPSLSSPDVPLEQRRPTSSVQAVDGSAVTMFTLFKENFKTNSRRGCQTSLLANINPNYSNKTVSKGTRPVR